MGAWVVSIFKGERGLDKKGQGGEFEGVLTPHCTLCNMREKSRKFQSVTKCCRSGKRGVLYTNVEDLSCTKFKLWVLSIIRCEMQ